MLPAKYFEFKKIRSLFNAKNDLEKKIATLKQKVEEDCDRYGTVPRHSPDYSFFREKSLLDDVWSPDETELERISKQYCAGCLQFKEAIQQCKELDEEWIDATN